MYRVYATWLESFRRYLTTDWMTEEKLIASITGRGDETPEMQMGTAVHAIIERPHVYVVSGDEPHYLCDDFRFSKADIDKIVEAVKPSGLTEFRTSKTYRTEYGLCAVVSRVDQIHGTTVSENKTKWSSFDITSYEESIQWRLYLDAFEATACQYNVFCMKRHEPSEKDPGPRYHASLRSIEQFTMYPYPGMHEECTDLLNMFLHFLFSKDLTPWLEPKRMGALDEY